MNPVENKVIVLMGLTSEWETRQLLNQVQLLIEYAELNWGERLGNQERPLWGHDRETKI